MKLFTLINLNMLYIKYTDGNIRRQCHLPLGPLYLISALKLHNIAVDFRDYQLCEAEELYQPEVFADFLKDSAPIIGISCMANLIPFVLFALPYLKEKYPDKLIILGGVGATDIEQVILERFKEVDIIHKGEGDESVPILLKALLNKQALDHVPNIFYRKNGKIIKNPSLPRIKDLDTLPMASYQGLDFTKYIGHNILGSRGCPFPCTFCSIIPIWDWKAYSRSNQNIIAEMKKMHETYGVKQFLFQDEFFVSSPERIIDFADQLKQADMDITYKVFARVDLVNKDSLKALGESGCVEIRFGVESGSDKILALTKKGFRPDTVLQVLTLAKKYIRSVDAFYVWGFPFETMEDFSQTIMQMITLRGIGVRVLPSLLTYLPQTAIYKNLEDKSALEFCPYLLPEYMVSGIEKRLSVRVDIDRKYSELFQFVIKNKDIFPGFFHLNIEKDIIPKLEILEELDFYNTTVKDSCGAHSPSKDAELTLLLG